MSYSYFLVCMDCKTGLYLGKSMKIFNQCYESDSYGFSSISSSEQYDTRATFQKLLEIQHFLMLHRTHELRVLPSIVECYANDIGFPQSFPDEYGENDNSDIYSRSEFFKTDVGMPNAEKELESLDKATINKLKTF